MTKNEIKKLWVVAHRKYLCLDTFNYPGDKLAVLVPPSKKAIAMFEKKNGSWEEIAPPVQRNQRRINLTLLERARES